MSRTNFISRFRTRWNRLPTLNQFSDAQRSEWLDSALEEYSDLESRKNVIGKASFSQGSRTVVLPDDFHRSTPSINLWNSLAASTVSNSTYSYTSISSGFYTGTRYDFLESTAPPGPPVANIQKMYVGTGYKNVWVLPGAANATVDGELTYNAYHVVSGDDTSGVNTLSPSDERFIFTLMASKGLRQLAADTTAINPSIARAYFEQAAALEKEARQNFGRGFSIG